MSNKSEVCCSSPASMCYWLAVSIVAWGFLGLVGMHWRLLRALSAQTILFAMAIGCIANWTKNRTLHCGITAPLFLIAAGLLLLSGAGVVYINPNLILPAVIAVTGIAFLIEWRHRRN
jgi:hypothetical protein